MNAPNYAAEVFISYAGNDAAGTGDNRDQLVIDLSDRLKQHNLLAKEYKRDVHYKGNLESYMDDIAYGDFIILLVSEKYLKSEYCMYEAVGVLNRNKRNLHEKIFPVILPDAQIFDTGKRIGYIEYWEGQFNNLTTQLAGKDPLKYGGLNDIAKNYREISENIDGFISALVAICQLSKDLTMEQKYQQVIDSVLQQLANSNSMAVAAQASPAIQVQELSVLTPQVINIGNVQDVAALSKSANDFISRVISKVDDIILDSEKAKKEYININFEEISGEQPILPATLSFIYSLRSGKTKYEPYRQSLIISALSLGLIKKYDETKARLLMDFATDDDPVLSNRALAGVVLGMLNKENFLSKDIVRKLETLKDNGKIQRCLLAIFFIIGNLDELHRVQPTLLTPDYKKFEFFDLTQHWFQPFYPGNPVLEKNIPDQIFADQLLQSNIVFGLESTKYAIALLFATFTKENMEQFRKFSELENSVILGVQTAELKSKLVLEIEATKYILEFYLYGSAHNDTGLVSLIEDQEGLRTGYLYKLVLNETSQNLLKANQYFFKKAYTEAALMVKPVLEDQPNNIEALLIYGYSSYYEGNFAAVIPTFEKLKAKGIKEILLLSMLGDAYFSTQQYEKAIENYLSLIVLQQNIPALLSIARGYELQAVPDNTLALEYYQKAFALEPGNYNTLLLLGNYYMLLAEPDYANAFIYYEKAFAIDSKNISLLKAFVHCIVHLPSTTFETAKNVLETWISLEPANTYPYLVLGDQYANKTPAESLTAFDHYLMAFDIDKNNLELLHSLDAFILKARTIPFEKATKIYKQLIELEPENKAGYNGMGFCYLSLEPPDYENAFAYYSKEFTYNQTTELVSFLLQCAAQLKNPDAQQVNDLYTSYSLLEPGSAKPDLAMADYLFMKTAPEPEKAAGFYERALAIEPGNKEVLFAAGKFYQGIPNPDYEKSAACLEAFLLQVPDDNLANAYLGWNNFIHGRYETAKKYFEKCETGDEDGTTHQNLGHIALIEKDAATAKKMYRTGYALFKNKDDFYPFSINDYKYLEKSGISKDEFDTLLKEVIATADDK